MSKFPEFEDEKEARGFFDTHSTIAYLEDTEPEQVKLSEVFQKSIQERREKKQPITLKLSPSHLRDAKRLARRKGIPYQTLIQLWISEGIEKEYRKEQAS
ncbi:hypothetical protein HKBW3S42_00592 [Candidatus Hakubella thermalkaliphila]|uniref:Antitoxin n=1 Tax=Candidatus Hakubella thermalkaliphila TaxID=2754717 RepID=A0A6V8P0U8_9ACTN|nr:CopG family antitoxin [Candidatus Hakubella thermalkaliphila]MBT9170733.1 hypothetical protein [Actinomycetota bacterium]GFP25370.1 hypothetical protein HKBW3S25_00842 [Candidatus Hakubella thermalkaliphila]GFP27018.1 hypothetical protein HKBW3S33_00431 [Candidatus Hakubella thermalkaliphila]GFP32286.1 hypothetical protein HKBW3S42_00592 [Candidatus Hakubella thermalkaliphila]GFP34694.1 hypothetical protein HKBW3S43_00486 [Candidatus Hakubella thermalkaliphila]